MVLNTEGNPVTKTEVLRSPANPLIKEVRRAIERGAATRDGDCVAEGFHLLEEALASRRPVRAVLATASAVPRLPELGGARLVVLEDALFRSIAATETSQGVLALVRPPAWHTADLLRPPALVVVLDGLQDPGNAGAILRAAEAFGASGAIFVKGTVNASNPKAVRASAGSLFRLPLVAGLDPAAVRAALAGLDLYAALPDGAQDLAAADLRRPCALVVGSEGHGVSAELRAGAVPLRIPMTGVESLNAAMAAGILLYEARRQRNSR